MKKEDSTILEELKGTAEDVISQLKAIVKKGNAKRVMVKNRKGKIFFKTRLPSMQEGGFSLSAIPLVLPRLPHLAPVAGEESVGVRPVAEERPKEDTYE